MRISNFVWALRRLLPRLFSDQECLSVPAFSLSCIFSLEFQPSPHPQMFNTLFTPPPQPLIRDEPHFCPDLLHAHLCVHKDHPFPTISTNVFLVFGRPS